MGECLLNLLPFVFDLLKFCGRPGDEQMQREIVGAALALLESTSEPRTTLQTPFVWSDDDSWKDAYARVDPTDADKLRRLGNERRARRRAGP